MTRNIAKWLEGLGLGKLAGVFDSNDIDFSALPQISEQDLKDLGLTVGARRKVMAAIALLDRETIGQEADATSSKTDAVETAKDDDAERRQLTVMFCDLVGSTPLSTRLDPEDLREVMREYQDTVSGIVERFGGYVANFLGDGVVAYFGWPSADEDQALQAVRAGLASVDAVASLARPDGDRLSARVGLATGTVVVGTLAVGNVEQAGAIAGDTPNMAARLQAEAAPGEVVIGGILRHLLSSYFALHSLGQRHLRGLSEPVAVWRVDREISGQSRFDTTHAGPLTNFVGREHELGLLIDRWEMASEREGQVVLVSGEAGIGKSRLCETFRSKVRSDRQLSLRYQCAPEHATSPLYPPIQQLNSAAGIKVDDSNDQKLDKLEALIGRSGDTGTDTVKLFANLLGLSFGDRFGELNYNALEIKNLSLCALANHLVQLATKDPVLLIVEDAHWMDPTSTEFFDLVAGQIQTSQILVLMTHRPEWISPFNASSHIASLQLNRLGSRHVREMVHAVAKHEMNGDVIDEIIRRTDGVPLFVEEVTRTLAETGVDPDQLNIPATLQALLLTRLDRLGKEAKGVAQAGAVVGRQFSREMLETLSGLQHEDLTLALDRLVESQLLYRLPNGTEYLFKHALVRDAAYQSLLRARRRHLHRTAADTSVARFTRHGEGSAELVAFHYMQAEALTDAAEWWIRAGEASARASANSEATSHYRNALAALSAIENGEQRDQLELTAWVGLGPLAMASEGVGSAAVADAYENSVRLAAKLEDQTQLFRSRFGTWHLNNVKGNARKAKFIADKLLAQAAHTGDEHECLQAHHASWSTAWMRADFRYGLDQIEKGRALYDQERHTEHKFVYAGHDPGVCSHLFGSWHFMSTGNVDRALAETDAAFRLSRSLEHPYSTSTAYLGTSISMRFIGLWDRLDQYNRDGIDLCLDFGLKSWLPVLRLSAACLQLENGDDDVVADGITAAKEALNMWTGAGAGTFLPWFYYEVANGHLKIGELDEAANAIERAKRQCEINDERWLEPEILRLEAELFHRSGRELEAVSDAYSSVVAHARELGTNLTGFRASLDHAQLLVDANAHELAVKVLADGWDVTDTAGVLSGHEVRKHLLKELRTR